MSKAASPIVVSGSIAIDRIMGFDGKYTDHILPDKLSSLSVSIFLQHLQDCHGGVGANIAYSLALLGDSPILLGAVGTDADSYTAKLAMHGVDVTHVHRSTIPTASCNVISDRTGNQVTGFFPGAMFDSATLSFAPWRDANPIAVVSPHDPVAMKRQVAECAKWDLRLCYDIGQQVSNTPATDMAEGIDAAHVLILNDYEISALAKKTGRSIDGIKQRVPIVITTLGENGSIIEGTALEAPIEVGIVPPARIADPTGAGDAFRAGFLYGYSRDWSLKSSAQLGAACAAYAIEHQGTQDHTFTLNDVSKRYEQAFGEAPPHITKQGRVHANQNRG